MLYGHPDAFFGKCPFRSLPVFLLGSFFFFFNLELREHFASLETNSLFLTSVETFIFPPPGDLPNLGIEPRSPALQADSLSAEPLGKLSIKCCQYCCLENRVASIILN